MRARTSRLLALATSSSGSPGGPGQQWGPPAAPSPWGPPAPPWGQPAPAPPIAPVSPAGGFASQPGKEGERSAGPDGYGHPDGYGQPDHTSRVPTPPRGRRHAPLTYVVVLVATALVSGGVGATIALAASGSTTASLPSAVESAPPLSPQHGLSVQAIAARVDAATVDITASGSPAGPDEGTGMVLTPSGVVLTNNHVIDGSTELTAQVDGAGRTYDAVVLGTDATKDVALLQLKDASGLPTVTIGNSSSVAVGDQVVAIGNALAIPGPETVTTGIISATDRSVAVSDPSSGLTEDLSGLLQTSAAINPGNSGGPLVDSDGDVIGMDTAAAGSTSDGTSANNVGFAIPINTAMAIARQVMAGKATATVQIGTPAILGVGDLMTVACAEGQDGCAGLGVPTFGFPFGGYIPYSSPVRAGAVVGEVEQGTPAASAGLETGDVVTEVDGRPVSGPDQLAADLRGGKVGQKVTLSWVDQNGSRQSATVYLVQGPNV